MYTISIYIDYYYQIQRCRDKDFASFFSGLRGIAENYGMEFQFRKEHPVVLQMDDAGPFASFQLACFIEDMDKLLRTYKNRFPRITLFADTELTPGMDHEALFERSRFTLAESPRIVIAPLLREELAEFFTIDESLILASPARMLFRAYLADADAEIIVKNSLPLEQLEAYCTDLERSASSLQVLRLSSLLQDPRSAFACVQQSASRFPVEVLCSFAEQAIAPLNHIHMEQEEKTEANYLSQQNLAYYNLPMLVSGTRLCSQMLFSSILPEWVESSCEQMYRMLFEARVRKALDSAQTPWLVCWITKQFSDLGLGFIANWIYDSSIQHLGKVLLLTHSDIPKSIPLENARILSAAINQESMDAILEQALGSSSGTQRAALKNWYSALLQHTKDKLPAKRVEQLLSLVPPSALAYLYILVRGGDFSDIDSAEAIAETMFGIHKNTRAVLDGILAQCGLRNGRGLLPGAYAIDYASFLREPVKNHIDAAFRDYLLQNLSSGSVFPSLELLKHTGIDISEEYMIQCAIALSQRPDYELPELPEKLPEAYTLIARFYSSLAHNDNAEAQQCLVALGTKGGSSFKTIQSLMETEFAFASANIPGAHANAKKAILSIREDTSPKIKSRIHRLMGLLCFVIDRTTEGSEYLNNALSFAAGCRDLQEQCFASYGKAVEEYLFNSLSRSMQYAGECQSYAEAICRPDYIIAAKSLQGRIHFDLGLYDDSAQQFLQASILASQYNMEAARVRSALWHSRALAYCGRIPEARSILDQWTDDGEALFFLAEAELLRENLAGAASILEPDPVPSPKPFSAADTLCWDSLFQEFEGKKYEFEILSGPLNIYYRFFRSYLKILSEIARYARDPSREESIKTQVAELQETGRKTKAICESPYAPQFLYWIYELAEACPFPTIDKHTALSRSFKAFQNRSGKIDDRTSRNLYMNKNRWNQKIIDAAQRYHFI